MLKTIRRMWLDLAATVLGWLGFVLSAYDSIYGFKRGDHPVQDAAAMMLTCILGILMGYYTHDDIVKYRRLRKEGK